MLLLACVQQIEPRDVFFQFHMNSTIVLMVKTKSGVQQGSRPGSRLDCLPTLDSPTPGEGSVQMERK